MPNSSRWSMRPLQIQTDIKGPHINRHRVTNGHCYIVSWLKSDKCAERHMLSATTMPAAEYSGLKGCRVLHECYLLPACKKIKLTPFNKWTSHWNKLELTYLPPARMKVTHLWGCFNVSHFLLIRMQFSTRTRFPNERCRPCTERNVSVGRYQTETRSCSLSCEDSCWRTIIGT